jgi:hypothetical protein
MELWRDQSPRRRLVTKYGPGRTTSSHLHVVSAGNYQGNSSAVFECQEELSNTIILCQQRVNASKPNLRTSRNTKHYSHSIRKGIMPPSQCAYDRSGSGHAIFLPEERDGAIGGWRMRGCFTTPQALPNSYETGRERWWRTHGFSSRSGVGISLLSNKNITILKKNNNWATWPRRMLSWKCIRWKCWFCKHLYLIPRNSLIWTFGGSRNLYTDNNNNDIVNLMSDLAV